MVRSSQKPGQVTIYYPLRSVGGVSFDVGGVPRPVTPTSTAYVDTSRDYAVKLTAPAQPAVDNLISSVKKYLQEGETVAWYANRNMLKINAQEDNLPFIKDMLEFLDTPQRQIIIEAAVWEVTDASTPSSARA